MAKLVYTALMSLDGYIQDKDGNFDWATPDAEAHAFINDIERGVGTYLYGRRMYEVMAVWQTMPTADDPPCIVDYAKIWRAAKKVVYSKTLQSVSTPKTEVERRFEPDTVRRMKASATRDLSIGGPTLAAHAFKAGIVDECHLFIAPAIIGGGTSAFPSDDHLELRLQEERRFRSGMVYLRYRASTG